MKTKIICTIGPASSSEEMIVQLISAGMSVARVNCSHGTIESNEATIRRLQKVRSEIGCSLAIMLDTKGPDIRIGHFDGGFTILQDGQKFTLTTKQCMGDNSRVYVEYKKFPHAMKRGQIILLNDGFLKAEVISADDTDVVCKILIGGKLSDRKSLYAPDADMGLPFLSTADKLDLDLAIRTNVDYIAASFVGTEGDVLEMKKYLHKHGMDIPILAKIESKQGVANIDEILETAEGIMTARGDLGVEYPIEQIPTIQKLLTKKAVAIGKLVITATEMLESMIEKPRPTRAETTDIANAVYDGTSCLMLSGETATGKYPIKAVEFMRKIAGEAEANIDYFEKFYLNKVHVGGTKHAFAKTISAAAFDARAKAIVVFTESGGTAIRVAKFHPQCKIYAFAREEKVFHQLAMYNDIIPIYHPHILQTAEMLQISNDYILKHNIAKTNDIIIVNASYRDTDTDLVLIHPLTRSFALQQDKP
jgi:pyruvate kinase